MLSAEQNDNQSEEINVIDESQAENRPVPVQGAEIRWKKVSWSAVMFVVLSAKIVLFLELTVYMTAGSDEAYCEPPKIHGPEILHHKIPGIQSFKFVFITHTEELFIMLDGKVFQNLGGCHGRS